MNFFILYITMFSVYKNNKDVNAIFWKITCLNLVMIYLELVWYILYEYVCTLCAKELLNNTDIGYLISTQKNSTFIYMIQGLTLLFYLATLSHYSLYHSGMAWGCCFIWLHYHTTLYAILVWLGVEAIIGLVPSGNYPNTRHKIS